MILTNNPILLNRFVCVCCRFYLRPNWILVVCWFKLSGFPSFLWLLHVNPKSSPDIHKHFEKMWTKHWYTNVLYIQSQFNYNGFILHSSQVFSKQIIRMMLLVSMFGFLGCESFEMFWMGLYNGIIFCLETFLMKSLAVWQEGPNKPSD